VLRFTDPESARQLLSCQGRSLAAGIVDPMPSRGGLAAPKPEFVAAVQDTARKNGVLVIADEVLNLGQSFRGASALYGLVPDLVTMGKIIGGDLPIGVIGGREEVLRVFDASAAGLYFSNARHFSQSSVCNSWSCRNGESQSCGFANLDELGYVVRDGIARSISRRRAPLCVTGAASLFRIHPMAKAPNDNREAYPSPGTSKLMKQLAHFLVESASCSRMTPRLPCQQQ